MVSFRAHQKTPPGSNIKPKSYHNAHLLLYQHIPLSDVNVILHFCPLTNTFMDESPNFGPLYPGSPGSLFFNKSWSSCKVVGFKNFLNILKKFLI